MQSSALPFGLCIACGFRTRPHVCKKTDTLKRQCLQCNTINPSPTPCCSVLVLKGEGSTRSLEELDLRALPSDPTLAQTFEVSCPRCSVAEAVFFRAPFTSDVDGMKLAFVCIRCSESSSPP